MLIGGFQKFTLIDYPGKLACIIFTQGCNLRCPYCYNRSLVLPELFDPPIPEEEVFNLLSKRKGFLEGVVITGGEPTVQPDLGDFLKKIKEMGFLVKLDTNGTHPEIINPLINKGLIDYIAMDVKAPLYKYKEVTRTEFETGNIVRSIKLIMESGVEYEFRTTVVKEQLSRDDVIKIGEMIRGARRYALQKFLVTDSLLDPSFKYMHSYTESELEEMAKVLKKYVNEVIIR